MINVNISSKVILPHFKEHINNTNTYQMFVGSAGSGKSHFIVQRALIMAMSEEYFRLVFARKTHESIKDSQFQLFKDYINNWGLSSVFQIKEQGMDIICVNGNMLLSTGLDNEEKIKSIADPTHVWIEEALGDKKSSAITREDFNQLDIRLRGKKGKNLQIWMTYNPVNEKSWIKEDFHTDEMITKHIEKSKVDDCSIMWSNYKDNVFIDTEAYEKKLTRMGKTSPNFFQVYALGKWGKPEVQRPYISNFSVEKHVSDVQFNPNKIVYLSIDFNKEPFVCLASHQWRDEKGIHLHFFKEFVLDNGDIEQMAQALEVYFKPKQLNTSLWTGDATGRKRDVIAANNMSAWKLLAQRLKISTKRINTPRANPTQKDNRFLCEYIFAHHPDLKIDTTMTLTINELQFTEADSDGKILKKDRNKEEQRADALDCVRYNLNTWSKIFYQKDSFK